MCTGQPLHFEFKGEDEVKIPPMTMKDLENILNKKMKLGKACDIYQLTVEHLRFCGEEAKNLIIKLINRIIANIYFLTCPQIKVGVGSALHKGKINLLLSQSHIGELQ